jgi:hypothetical protein
VPGPLEQSLFRRSGVLNFNLSCNSLLEEVLVGIVSCQVLFLNQRGTDPTSEDSAKTQRQAGPLEITVVNIRTPTPRRKPSSRHTNVVIVKNYNDK